MKLPLIVVLLFSLTFASARVNQKVYQNGNVNNIVPTPEGGFVLTGFIYTNSNNKCFVMKFDSSGNPDFSKSYSDLLEFYSYGIKTIPIPGSGYLFTGVMFHDTISNEEITLSKSDLSGNLLWTKNYGNPFDDDEVGSMIMTNNGILLAGHSTSFGPGGEDFFLIKTDSSGNLQWSKTFGTARDERGIAFLPYQNGFVFGGYGKETTGNNNDLFLVFLDSAANIINAVQFVLSGNQQLMDIDVDPSGNVLIAATTEATINYPHALFIKLSAGGNILWSKTLLNDYSIPHKISVVPGGCIAAGETRTQLNHENSFIIEMDDNGMVTGENYFGDSTGLIIKSFFISNDSLFLAGEYKRPGQQHPSVYVNKYIRNDTTCNHYSRNSTFQNVTPAVYIDNWQAASPATVETNAVVLGLNANWNDSIICDYNISTNEFDQDYSFFLIPNPSNSNAILTLPFENKEVTISIINAEGSIVDRFITRENTVLLSIGDLPAGVYSVQVIFKELTLSKRLIIQH